MKPMTGMPMMHYTSYSETSLTNHKNRRADRRQTHPDDRKPCHSNAHMPAPAHKLPIHKQPANKAQTNRQEEESVLMAKNPHKVFGLSRNSTCDQIKSRYKELAKDTQLIEGQNQQIKAGQ